MADRPDTMIIQAERIGSSAQKMALLICCVIFGMCVML
jgi:hypothetical protein